MRGAVRITDAMLTQRPSCCATTSCHRVPQGPHCRSAFGLSMLSMLRRGDAVLGGLCRGDAAAPIPIPALVLLRRKLRRGLRCVPRVSQRRGLQRPGLQLACPRKTGVSQGWSKLQDLAQCFEENLS